MERRKLLLGLVVALVSLFATSATASAHRSAGRVKPAVETPICVIHSLPAFMDQGEFEDHSSVADVIEIECQPVFAEHKVAFSAHELASRCDVAWIWSHSPFKTVEEAPTVHGVLLDDAGNAEVALAAGPSCAPGEVLISAHLEEAPYTTVSTSFTVLAPHDTTPGVEVLGATDALGEHRPAVQVEDDFDSSLFAIVQVEFPSVYAEQEVEISAEQLFSRCLVAPKLVWFAGSVETKTIIEEGKESIRLKLDNNGNAAAIIDAEESCASGTSEIEASLVKAPYTTYTTPFTIESPHETV